MNYPIWDVPLISGGIVIAIVAIVHVFISHFAVGGGIYLVLTERKARRENDEALLGFLRSQSLFFLVLTLVAGALTGVGIWFTISLVTPDATSTLLHVFVWIWATEWVFFLVEIISILVYYYGWDRLEPKDHMRVGWIYAGSAWMSLVLITGILTFMLTPGAWTDTHDLHDAFFNPTFWPSVLLRTGVAVALGGRLRPGHGEPASRPRAEGAGDPLFRALGAVGLRGHPPGWRVVPLCGAGPGPRPAHRWVGGGSDLPHPDPGVLALHLRLHSPGRLLGGAALRPAHGARAPQHGLPGRGHRGVGAGVRA